MIILYKHITNLTKLALLCLSLFLIPMQSHAKDVSFEWTAIPEPLTGYKLYSQEEGNEVGTPIVLGKVTTHTLTGLSPDKTYHFFLTAYNDAGEGQSSEIVSILPTSSLSPTIVKITTK